MRRSALLALELPEGHGYQRALHQHHPARAGRGVLKGALAGGDRASAGVAQKLGQMQMTGNVEHDFMATMRQHHLHGIELAKVALKHTKDAKVRQFAQKTIKTQQRDVKELDAWLAKHPAKGSGGSGNAP